MMKFTSTSCSIALLCLGLVLLPCSYGADDSSSPPQQLLRSRERKEAASSVTTSINTGTTTAASTASSTASTTSDNNVLDVVIIGAGAAGLSAAYSLNREVQQGMDINYVILEVSDDIGGRAKTDTTFTNGEYTLDLGPSFIQFPDDISRIVDRNDATAIPNGAAPNTIFVNGFSYQRFLKDFIAPTDVLNGDKIAYGCRVTSVDYSVDNGPVTTVCGDGRIFSSQYAIATVPLSILQDDSTGIDFIPALPNKLTSGHPGFMWGGFKVILELTQDLTDTTFCYGGCETDNGESYFWEFSSVNQVLENGNVLMMGYIAGDPALHPEFELDNEALGQLVLDLLDEQFNGQASEFHVRHMIQNWSQNPDIRGTWSSAGYGTEGAQKAGGDNNNKLWIAGEAFPIGERGWVDAAAFSGDDAARQILELMGIETSDKNDKGSSFWNKVADDLGRN